MNDWILVISIYLVTTFICLFVGRQLHKDSKTECIPFSIAVFPLLNVCVYLCVGIVFLIFNLDMIIPEKFWDTLFSPYTKLRKWYRHEPLS